jgi:uncharacterized protein with GYD domain
LPRYLWQASYTVEGFETLLKDGCTNRRLIVQRLVESLGGRLELFDYALGNEDAFVVAQLPNDVAAIAVSMAINATGKATVRTSALVTPDEVDQAHSKRAKYAKP